MHWWIWVKFCVSTGVGTWTNWLTFEPIRIIVRKIWNQSKIWSRSNRHLTQSRLQVTGCTVERYCLLHVVVPGQGVSSVFSTFLYDVRLRSYGASNLTNFWISAYFPIYHVYVLARPDAATTRGYRMVLLSRRSRQWERLSASVLSTCSSVCLSVAKMQKNAIFSKTKQFTAMVSINDL